MCSTSPPATTKADTPRPVLLFVAGDTFTGDRGAPDLSREIQDQAMCFAARNGMIGVRVNYRLAPSATWPMGAPTWRRRFLDPRQYRPVQWRCPRDRRGRLWRRRLPCRELLAHPDFRPTAPRSRGSCWCPGIYRAGKDASDNEKAYLGTDAAQYDKRLVFPGILNVDVPIVLAWAADRSGQIVAQGETLKKTLCGAGHCPRPTLAQPRRYRGGVRASMARATVLLSRRCCW